MAKKMLLVIVAVVIVAVVCVALFVVLSGDKDNKDDTNVDETTYWFYINYGAGAPATVSNEWISASGGNSYEALCKALDAKGYAYDIQFNQSFESGTINGINGVAPEWDATAAISYGWSLFAWTGDTYDSTLAGWEETLYGIGHPSLTETTYYIAVVGWNTTTFTTTFNPNTTTGWKTGGPFASA